MPKELREKKVEELKSQERELREELFKLKMQHKTGQLEKSHRLGELKKQIARVLTIIQEKQRKAA